MKKTALFLALAVSSLGTALAADPAKIDWGRIPVVTVPLFYPGQSSYEWLLSDAHKGAAKEMRRGDACTLRSMWPFLPLGGVGSRRFPATMLLPMSFSPSGSS